MNLSVNIDHVATLRNARGEKFPDPIEAALLCERAGAVGIVCHLREDRRHITDRDVFLLREKITTKLDLEMAATEEMKKIAISIKPNLVTLVPEKREELTTEGGLDIQKRFEYLKDYIDELQSHHIPVSIFIEPEKKIIDLATELRAKYIELHTGEFSRHNTNSLLQEKELQRIQLAAQYGKNLGMEVVAGHGLDYINSSRITAIKEIHEVSIGYAIIARAVFVGLETAVREMIHLMA